MFANVSKSRMGFAILEPHAVKVIPKLAEFFEKVHFFKNLLHQERIVPDLTLLGKKRSSLYEMFANGFTFCNGFVILELQAVKVR